MTEKKPTLEYGRPIPLPWYMEWWFIITTPLAVIAMLVLAFFVLAPLAWP